jgi:hypothetical protein
VERGVRRGRLVRCERRATVALSRQSSLADASTIVIPWEGALLGWRNTVPRPVPAAATTAQPVLRTRRGDGRRGPLDASIIVFGGVWDFAATSLIVREAGGVFRDAWGGERLDTATGIFTNAKLIDAVLATLGDRASAGTGPPKLAKTVSEPIGTPEEIEIDPWRAFGIRRLASMSARQRIVEAPSPILAIVDERVANLERPFLGSPPTARSARVSVQLDGHKIDTRPIADAVSAFLQALTPEQRKQTMYSMDATEWRTWINVHMNHFRHGVMLEDLAQPVRDLALEIVRSTMSARGYYHARSIMLINEFIAQLSGDY